MTEPQISQDDENRLIAERRVKLAALRAKGVAFPNDFVPADRAQALHDAYDTQEQEALATAATVLAPLFGPVAGVEAKG